MSFIACHEETAEREIAFIVQRLDMSNWVCHMLPLKNKKQIKQHAISFPWCISPFTVQAVFLFIGKLKIYSKKLIKNQLRYRVVNPLQIFSEMLWDNQKWTHMTSRTILVPLCILSFFLSFHVRFFLAGNGKVPD